jgi:hypothetical protein
MTTFSVVSDREFACAIWYVVLITTVVDWPLGSLIGAVHESFILY